MPENEPREMDEAASPKLRPAPMRVFFNAAHLYKSRAMQRPFQELLALFGIAAGVALLYAVQVASSSVTGSLKQASEGVTGSASIAVVGRSESGIDQQIVAKIDQMPGVRLAAPVVLKQIAVSGPAGRAPLTLVGVDDRLQRAGGQIARQFLAQRRDLDALGVFLTEKTAREIGVARGQEFVIETGAQKRKQILAGTLAADQIGSLVESPIAAATLGIAQRIAGMPGRISRVLVEPAPGQRAAVADRLRSAYGEKLDVRASDFEVGLLGNALQPDRQSSAIFSAIAVAIGLLFAYNAVILTLVFRRRFIVNLRTLGADRSTILTMLVFEVVVLGLAASIVGIALGEVISRLAFQSIPRYLTAGFPIGEQRIVGFGTIAVSVAGGLLAAGLALAKPAFDLFRAGMIPETESRPQQNRARLFESGWGPAILAIGAVVAASALAVFVPALSPLVVLALLCAIVLFIGPFTARALAQAHRFTRVKGDVGVAVAIEELHGSPNRAKALALISAGAIMAMVSIGGTRLDVGRGTKELNQGIFKNADLWVLNGGPENAFLTRTFDPRDAIQSIQKVDGVSSVGVLHGVFADIGSRRMLIAAHPIDDPYKIVPNQLFDGDNARVMRRIGAGGWVAVDDVFARARDVDVGDRVRIPTPAGAKTFRVAAKSGNYGWPSGVIVMSNHDFTRSWGVNTASALAVNFAAGYPLETGRRSIEQTLGSESAMSVRTPAETVSNRVATVGQGLSRLRQISLLVLLAGVLAIVAAMFTAVWQRRPQIAALRSIGMYRSELYRSLLVEIGVVVVLGGAVGMVAGVYAQAFTSRWIALSSGYYVPYDPAVMFGLVTCVQVLVLALLAAAVPAYLATRVRPSVGEAT